MRKCHVSELTGNEILAQSIYLEDGQILLKKGEVIESSYKESLLALNVEEVFVQDKYEVYERPNLYLKSNQIREFQQQLEDVLVHHVYKDNNRLKKLLKLATEMTDAVYSRENQKKIDVREHSGNIYEHIILTTLWSIIVGKECGCEKEGLEQIALGALLHDLGLCYVNADYKNCCFEKMPPVEIFELKKHTILAYTALEKETWIPEISKKMILSHHEKMDGSGYPLKQKNQELECKIIQVCDTADGILSGIEREQGTLEDALKELRNHKKYDSNVVKVFESKIAKYPVGTKMQIENGKEVIVVSQTEDSAQPEVIEVSDGDIHERRLTEKVIHIF